MKKQSLLITVLVMLVVTALLTSCGGQESITSAYSMKIGFSEECGEALSGTGYMTNDYEIIEDNIFVIFDAAAVGKTAKVARLEVRLTEYCTYFIEYLDD